MVLDTNKEAIEELEAACDGITMRQALIDLIETLNEVGGDVQNLDGHGSDYYVLVKEIEKVERDVNDCLKYDTVPTLNSLKVMQNKDITAYFRDGVLKKLKQINGDYKGRYDDYPADEIGNNIHDCLTILKNSIGLIESAIENKGVTIQDTDSVEDLPTRISEIKLANLLVKPITITENGKEIPEDIVRDREGHIISGTAYNPVTVNVQLKGYPGVFTTTGNHTPPTGYDGFSSAKIDVSGNGSGGAGGGSGSGENGEVKLTSQEILQNGEYSPPNGYDGFSDVIVNVKNFEPDDEGTYTVNFIYEPYGGAAETIETKQVNSGERAVFDGDIPEYSNKDFWYFKGWDPIPKNVITDMDVYAQYELWTPGPTAMGAAINWASVSWEEILENPRCIGDNQMKLLRLNDNSIVRVIKLGKVKDGSGRTCFLCMNPITIPQQYEIGDLNWDEEPVRTYLNGNFISTYIPDWLASKIATVSKCHTVRSGIKRIGEFRGVNGAQLPNGDFSPTQVSNEVVAAGTKYDHTDEKIWLPSADELQIYTSQDKEGDFLEGIYTSNNVDYKDIWTSGPYIDPSTGQQITRYTRTGISKMVYYKAAGRKATKIPRDFQRGLILRDSVYDGDIYKSPFVTYNLSTMKGYYKSGLHDGQSGRQVVGMTLPHDGNNYDRYTLVYNGSKGLYYDGTNMTDHNDQRFLEWYDAQSVNGYGPILRDVMTRSCTLNDSRINDTYSDQTVYTSPVAPADYQGGTDHCTAVYSRACVDGLGFITPGSGQAYWGFAI